jgi:hypothetical protein
MCEPASDIGNNTREADRLAATITSSTLLYGAWYDPQAFIAYLQVCGPFWLYLVRVMKQYRS